eukprot:3882929-Pleurochrysis_carterae.AAC.8
MTPTSNRGMAMAAIRRPELEEELGEAEGPSEGEIRASEFSEGNAGLQRGLGVAGSGFDGYDDLEGCGTAGNKNGGDSGGTGQKDEGDA